MQINTYLFLINDLEKDALQEVVRRIDHTPTDEGPRVVHVHALVEGGQASIPGDVHLARDVQESLEVAAYLGLHVYLYHVHRIEHRAGEAADQSAADKVRQQRLPLAQQHLRLIAQREEHEIGQAVSAYYGYQAAVTLRHAMTRQQVPERMRRVLEFLVITPILQQRLHSLERHQDGLRGAGQVRRHYLG